MLPTPTAAQWAELPDDDDDDDDAADDRELRDVAGNGDVRPLRPREIAAPRRSRGAQSEPRACA
eukprot:3684594-Prymnesium_polylepis.1